MYSILVKKIAGLAMVAVFGLTVGTAFAADTTDTTRSVTDATRASRNIDRALQRTANEFTDELDRADRQFHESQRLGVSSETQNRFGRASDIDNEIQRTVNRANEELRDATDRDDYTFKRRELETTRSLTYPGTPEYNRLTDQLDRLDRDFSTRESQYTR